MLVSRRRHAVHDQRQGMRVNARHVDVARRAVDRDCKSRRRSARSSPAGGGRRPRSRIACQRPKAAVPFSQGAGEAIGAPFGRRSPSSRAAPRRRPLGSADAVRRRQHRVERRGDRRHLFGRGATARRTAGRCAPAASRRDTSCGNAPLGKRRLRQQPREERHRRLDAGDQVLAERAAHARDRRAADLRPRRPASRSSDRRRSARRGRPSRRCRRGCPGPAGTRSSRMRPGDGRKLLSGSSA